MFENKSFYPQAPPEFKYRIKNLDFFTNYTVRVYSYDEQFRKGSKEVAMTSFATSACLPTTQYNYTICGKIGFLLLCTNGCECISGEETLSNCFSLPSARKISAPHGTNSFLSTHVSHETPKKGNCQTVRPRSDAAERGV